jgi:hypothetical protein
LIRASINLRNAFSARKMDHRVKPYGMHTSLQASIDREGTRWKTRVFSMLAVVRCVPALSTSMVV